LDTFLPSEYEKKEEVPAPVPGNAPIKLPMIAPKPICLLTPLNSLTLILDFNISLVAGFSFANPLLIILIISEKPNTPTIKTIIPTPSSNSTLPKVNLCAPVNKSIPTVAVNKPKIADIALLIRFLDAKVAIANNPKVPTKKYSGADIFNANTVNGFENNIRIKLPHIPPIVEAVKEKLIAFPGEVFFAYSNPSITVAAAAGVPGIPRVRADIDPPYSAD